MTLTRHWHIDCAELYEMLIFVFSDVTGDDILTGQRISLIVSKSKFARFIYER